MKKSDNIKNKKVAIIALLLLLITVIGATYAYFAAQRGAGGSANIEVGAGTTDSLTFNNEEGDITIVANQDNFGKSNQSITQSASVKAKLIPNNNTNSAHETYNIFLVVENNDLVYTKDNSSPELLLKITNPNSEEYTETVEGLKYYEDVTDKENASYKGYDITTSSNQVYKIVSDYEIDANEAEGTEQTWQVEATLVNLDQDQNNNTGKTFEGSIYITTDEDFKLSEVNTLKTTATTNSIEAVADITTGTSKIANYYFAIEKTSESPETIKLSSIANALGKEYIEETSNTHTFSEEIEENQNYKIYTYTTDEQGYKSNIYETVVTAKDGVLPEVGEVTTSATASKITLTYQDDTLEYRAKIVGGEWTEFNNTTNTITGLKDSTTYTIIIQAKNAEGVFSNIKTIEVKTSELPKEQNLTDFVISKVGTKVGEGTEALLQHTTDLENSAGDNSYRYSGNNPYNFVCFGNGSEDYNNGGDTCPDTNLYRIIGVFGNQIKLIKSEYITSAELGIDSDGKPSTGSYDTLKRVKVAPSDGFYWNKTADNTWESSTLYQALNNGESGYLNFLGTTWTNKIATTTWHVGGHNSHQVTPKVMYDAEIASNPTVSAQIGLMYTSDYGFASEQKNWISTLDNYDNNGNSNRANNWLYNNVYEWTISRNSSDSNYAFLVYNDGYVVNYYGVNDIAIGIRPSFYLNTDVKIKVDDSLGDVDHPFRIVV